MGAHVLRSGVVCLVVAMTALGAAKADGKEKIDCENASATAEMNWCAEQEFDAADAELNKVYAEALKSIPEMASEPPYDAKAWEGALRASQRAWVAYRDAECDAHVPMFWTGGSGATAEIIGCRTTMTKARTKEIQEHYMEH